MDGCIGRLRHPGIRSNADYHCGQDRKCRSKLDPRKRPEHRYVSGSQCFQTEGVTTRAVKESSSVAGANALARPQSITGTQSIPGTRDRAIPVACACSVSIAFAPRWLPARVGTAGIGEPNHHHAL